MIHWHIFSVGKPKLDFARIGIEDYTNRLRRETKLEFHELKTTDPAKTETLMLQRTQGMYRIILDERGQLIHTRSLSDKINHWQNQSLSDIALCIGGADGHTETFRKKADWLWSLSPLTLQHEMALLIVLEQLYRAHSILKGTPYHRD
jgi:23S rRNA (pseudouridine1915-N3)-methyltransferase